MSLRRMFEGDELVHNFLESMFGEIPKWLWEVSEWGLVLNFVS